MGWYIDNKKIIVMAEEASGNGAQLQALIENQLIGPMQELSRLNALQPLSDIPQQAGVELARLNEANSEAFNRLMDVVKNQEIEELVNLTKDYEAVKKALDLYDTGDQGQLPIVQQWMLRLQNLQSFAVDNMFVSVNNMANEMMNY